MRYILDTYIRAEDTRVVSELGNMSIVELLLQGKTTTPVDLVKDLPGNNEAKAETIDNNLQHEIVKKMSSNSVYYGKLSEMLKRIIMQRKIEAMSYEEYLRQVVELAEAILHPETNGSYPDKIKDSAARRALYDYLGENVELAIDVDDAILPSCDTLIEYLSAFFIVSRISVKYRLIEVGLLGQISNFEDFDAVFSEINNSEELVALTPVEAYQLMNLDSSLREWVSGGQFVFADGYFVLAEEKYITAREDGLHLTARAKKNLAQCVINIHEQKYTTYRNIQKDFLGFAVLHKVEGIDQRMLTFHPKYQANFQYEADDVYSAFRDHILSYDTNEEIELVKRLSDPTTTLCQCLWFLMERRKWTYPETFHDNTGLHKNYHGKIKNDKYNNMGTDVLMAICVGLKLSLRIVEMIFAKSSNKLNYYKDPDKTYIRILEFMPGISLQDFNGILKQADFKELGSTIKDSN